MIRKPDLLLHICCAPCCTHAIEVLSETYHIHAFFFNPNIFPPDEYYFRLEETRHYVEKLGLPFIAPKYSRKEWLSAVQHYADEPEGGRRCEKCFDFRLLETAKTAVTLNVHYFTTTLTTGPNKPASAIFPLAENIALKFGLTFVSQDFKKHDGFKKSCELSKRLGMYRQNYCGCEYSLRDRNRRIRSPKQAYRQTRSTEPYSAQRACLPNKPPQTSL
ncbi:MAG: epoxyqueuosine reductase QueH [bacterium]